MSATRKFFEELENACRFSWQYDLYWRSADWRNEDASHVLPSVSDMENMPVPVLVFEKSNYARLLHILGFIEKDTPVVAFPLSFMERFSDKATRLASLASRVFVDSEKAAELYPLPWVYGKGDSYEIIAGIDPKIEKAYVKRLLTNKVESLWKAVRVDHPYPRKPNGKPCGDCVALANALCLGNIDVGAVMEGIKGRSMAEKDSKLLERYVRNWAPASEDPTVKQAFELANKLDDIAYVWETHSRPFFIGGPSIAPRDCRSPEKLNANVREYAVDNGLEPLIRALFAGVPLEDLPLDAKGLC